MSRDLTIRLLGRPQVTVDQRTGFSKLSRRYVVQGPRATLAGISDATNPLFLAAGTADEEFTDYYLVDQSLSPASGTLDKAYLVREYLQLSSSAISEAFQQSNDLIRVRKRFAVLRNEDANLGYGTLWSSHPSQSLVYAMDPWQYAPSWVANATPGSRNYTVDNADDATQHGFADAPQIDGQNLGTYISSHASTGDWLKGYAVMSQAGSGLDIWTVEWVTHAPPYWQLGTGSGKRSRSSTASVLDFDEGGLHYLYSVASSGQVSYATRSMTYNFFVKGSNIPSTLAQIGGGSASVSFSPAVHVDLVIVDHEGRTTFERGNHKNSVWGGDNNSLNLPVNSASGVVDIVESSPGNSLKISWEATRNGDELTYETEEGGTDFVIGPDGSVLKDYAESDYLRYKNLKIKSIGGTISWTMSESSYSASSSSGTFGQTRTQIAPIFSHGSEKIWKVAITYVGG